MPYQSPPMIPIIFEHDDFIVINKPSGISVHDKQALQDKKSEPTREAGIVSLVKAQISRPQLWLVHRLDKITSGCLILAKNAQTAKELGVQFETRQVQKYYLAISDKKPKKRQGSVIGDLKKVRDGKWILTRDKVNPSITHFFDKGLEQGLRLQIMKPYTGQTHQLRVVMSSLGATILGDEHYNGTDSDRTYLHAWQIQFQLRGQSYTIQSEPQTGQWFQTQAFKQLLQSISPPEHNFNWPDSKLVKAALNSNAS